LINSGLTSNGDGSAADRQAPDSIDKDAADNGWLATSFPHTGEIPLCSVVTNITALAMPGYSAYRSAMQAPRE
jgi:PPE-repeat protein